MEGRKGLPMPPWGQSCRDVVSNGTGAPPAGAPEHTGMLGRTRVGGSNACASTHRRGRSTWPTGFLPSGMLPVNMVRQFPEPTCPFSHPRH